MLTKDNEFNNNSYAILENTSSSQLDGVEVRVVGVSSDFAPIYKMYAIERKDGELWSN